SDRRGWIGAGALCALAAIWRLDFGVYAAIAAGAAAFAAAGRDGRADLARGDARRLRHGRFDALVTVAASFVAVTALVYLPFVIVDGPADAWRDLVGRSLSQGRYWHLPFPLGY